MKTKLRVVIDTNVLLVSISSRSKYHWVYQALLRKEFELFVTNEILTEYEEIIARRWHPEVAQSVMRVLLELNNVHLTTISFQMSLIEEDADDNKFADCAFANNVHCLVTHDSHFNVLKNLSFPKITVVSIHEFRRLLNLSSQQ
jgi:putative PIN family toxin of toxin-antitoxin system